MSSRTPQARKRIAWAGAILLALMFPVDYLVLRRDARAGWMGNMPASIVQPIARTWPRDAVAQYALGLHRMDVDDYAGAARYLGQAVRLDPGFLLAKGAYSTALWMSGSASQASGPMNDCLSSTENIPEAHVTRGWMYTLDDFWSKSEREASTALAVDPDSADAWLLRFRIAEHAGDWSTALAAAARLRKLRPQSYQGWLCSATWALHAGDFARAAEEAGRAVAMHPEVAEAQRVLALASLNSGRRDGAKVAETAVAAALRLKDYDPHVHVAAARVARHTGDRPTAIAHARRALALSVDANEARELLAELYAGTDPAQARRWQSEYERWGSYLVKRAAIMARMNEAEYDMESRFDLAQLDARMGLWNRADQQLRLGLSHGPSERGLALASEVQEHTGRPVIGAIRRHSEKSP